MAVPDKTNSHIFLAFLLSLSITSTTFATNFNVVTLGTMPDGVTDSTNAFAAAWAQACASTNPATIYVPQGRFLLRNVRFKGPCKNNAITFQVQGSLVAPADYNVLGNSAYWVSFLGVNGVPIYGGMLDGRGAALWACKKFGKSLP